MDNVCIDMLNYTTAEYRVALTQINTSPFQINANQCLNICLEHQVIQRSELKKLILKWTLFKARPAHSEFTSHFRPSIQLMRGTLTHFLSSFTLLPL